jgi:hypothetical protein
MHMMHEVMAGSTLNWHVQFGDWMHQIMAGSTLNQHMQYSECHAHDTTCDGWLAGTETPTHQNRQETIQIMGCVITSHIIVY